MRKKHSLLVVAIVVVAAIATPATASGLTLTDGAGKVEATKWLVGTSVNARTTHTAVGDLFCPHVLFAAEVQKNTGSLITASNASVGPLLNCETGEEAELTVTEPKMEHLETAGEDKGNAKLSFVADVGAFECPFGGTVPFTYGTGSTNDKIVLSGPISSSLLFCEEEEGGGEVPIFEGTFTLTTTNSSPVWIEPPAVSGLTLKDSSGKIAPGEWLVGTSTDTKLTHTSLGDLFCPNVALSSEVQTNSGSLITAFEGIIELLALCEVGSAEVVITEPTLKHLETTGEDKGTVTISFTLDVAWIECPYEGSIPFTYETGSSHNTLSISGQIFSKSFCAEEGGEGELEPAFFEGTYSLSTTNGSPVWIEPGA